MCSTLNITFLMIILLCSGLWRPQGAGSSPLGLLFLALLLQALRPAKAYAPNCSPLTAVIMRPPPWGHNCSGRRAAIPSGWETTATFWPPPQFPPSPHAPRSRVLMPYLSSSARCERSDPCGKDTNAVHKKKNIYIYI